MKIIRLLAALVIFLCITVSSQAQKRKTVYGNNKVVTKERVAGSFEGLRVSTGIDVYLKQGNKETITVEADENLHEYILTKIEGGILSIYTEVNIRDADVKKVYVTMKDISSVKASSAGDIIGESAIKSDEIELSASSAGDIKLEVYARELDVDISSSGDITLSGEADILKADLSSAGDFNGYNLKVREADVTASSAGDADINVTERLKANASSAADIHFTGNPKYVDAHSSSAAGIHKR
jgi:citrate lyase gamma subunit